ncbi:MAG: hypothetical protein M3323_04525 [Actinomycetota bacterium]|nr:hypothetical protein [Actinomycetota bacterium]
MSYQFTVAGKAFSKTQSDVVSAMKGKDSENIREHWAEINGTRYPVKQVLEAVTGVDRADFQSMTARRVLRQLGFGVGRG